MSTCINTIKWLLGLLVIALVLTYVISLNVENHFIAINTKWFSNDFLFAITAGAFASLLIVLICEIIKYRQMKLVAENALFTFLGNLYGQILIIRGNCKRALTGHDIVPDNLIQFSCENSMIYADHINGIDYMPFCSNNIIQEILTKFKIEKSLALKNVITGFSYLRIAIREDSKILLQQGKRDIVTSDKQNVNGTLKKIIAQTSTILTYLDQIISQIDDELDGRFYWNDKKKALNTYQDNYVLTKLYDYLKEDVVVF